MCYCTLRYNRCILVSTRFVLSCGVSVTDVVRVSSKNILGYRICWATLYAAVVKVGISSLRIKSRNTNNKNNEKIYLFIAWHTI